MYAVDPKLTELRDAFVQAKLECDQAIRSLRTLVDTAQSGAPPPALPANGGHSEFKPFTAAQPRNRRRSSMSST